MLLQYMTDLLILRICYVQLSDLQGDRLWEKC